MLWQPEESSDHRRFVTTPPTAEDRQDEPVRRVWEVEGDALLVVLGVLLDRVELEALFWEVDQESYAGIREDILLLDAVSRCQTRCRFAEVVESLLDRRAACLRRRLDGCPMSELAAFWLGARDEAAGAHLAAVLWTLARDRRWVIRNLQERVRGDIWVRALRALGSGRGRPKGETAG